VRCVWGGVTAGVGKRYVRQREK